MGYHLRISQDGSKPENWRMIEVHGGISLDRLSDVIQIVMGLSDKCSHKFEINGKRYTESPKKKSDGVEENQFLLEQVIGKDTAKFHYEFGGRKCFTIVVEMVGLLPDGENDRVCCVCGEGGDLTKYDDGFEFISTRKKIINPEKLAYSPADASKMRVMREIKAELEKFSRWSRPRGIGK